jgi:hypothetical protein
MFGDVAGEVVREVLSVLFQPDISDDTPLSGIFSRKYRYFLWKQGCYVPDLLPVLSNNKHFVLHFFFLAATASRMRIFVRAIPQ